MYCKSIYCLNYQMEAYFLFFNHNVCVCILDRLYHCGLGKLGFPSPNNASEHVQSLKPLFEPPQHSRSTNMDHWTGYQRFRHNGVFCGAQICNAWICILNDVHVLIHIYLERTRKLKQKAQTSDNLIQLVDTLSACLVQFYLIPTYPRYNTLQIEKTHCLWRTRGTI